MNNFSNVCNKNAGYQASNSNNTKQLKKWAKVLKEQGNHRNIALSKLRKDELIDYINEYYEEKPEDTYKEYIIKLEKNNEILNNLAYISNEMEKTKNKLIKSNQDKINELKKKMKL